MRKFLKTVLLYCLIMAIILMPLNALYLWRNSQNNYGTMGYYRNDQAFVDRVPDSIQVCDFGNSHGFYGFSYERVSDLTCFNFALTSQSISYNYRILSAYRERIGENAIVFICVSYSQLFGVKETDEAEFLSKNRRYYYFLGRNGIKQYSFKTALETKYCPIFFKSFTDWKNCFSEPEKGSWDQVTSKEQAGENGTNRFRYHVLDRKDVDGNRIYNEEEIGALRDMVRLCYEINAIPVLITTPYLDEYASAGNILDPEFDQDFHSVIQSVCDETGAEYRDYSRDERFSHSYDLFFNADHLNREGAKLFTSVLFEEIVDSYR